MWQIIVGRGAQRQMLQMLERDPVLIKKRFYEAISLNDDLERTMEQVKRCVEIQRSLPEIKRAPFYKAVSLYDRTLTMRFGIQYLFKQAMSIQSTPEQYAQWKDDIENWGLFGCFAMTELGTSSYLRGLETTATYDKETQSFIINTPTTTATKWWIGAAGHTATHAVVLANLYIDGNAKGLHWFVVQLRDKKTGTLMPGVAAGLVGPKAGRAGIDNGWIQFDSVVIPRMNMLMRFNQVSPSGEYSAGGNPAIAYASLIGERIFLIYDVYTHVAQALTIAVRYGAVRRQGPNSEKLLDYQSHQFMLMPTIAYMYATKCVGDKIGKDWDGFMNAQSTMNAKEWMGRLHDYHAVVSGLKALLGWRGAEQLEQIRLSMGGHAYHQFNAVPGIVADYGVLTTGGGDNTPLAQQTAKYLVASLQRVAKGSTVSGSVHYLNKHEAILVTASKGNKIEDFLNKEAIHSNLTFLATKLISHAAQRLLFDTAEGKAMSEAWNDNMMILIAASNAHSELYLYESFDAAVQQQRQHDSIYKPLSRLVQLLGLDIVVRSIDRLLEFEYLVPAQIFALREAFRILCRQVRADAVGLVDGFDFPDFILKAPVGRYDGNIYEAYFSMVRDYGDFGGGQAASVAPYWDKLIAPILASVPSRSKL